MLQAARNRAIEISDDEAKALVTNLAGRNKMTYEQFAEQLKDMNVDIATLVEKFRAQLAWQRARAHDATSSPPP